MNQNDIVTVLTPIGEVVGRLKGESETVFTIERPRMLMQTQQGMGFAPGIGMSVDPKAHDVDIQKAQVVAVVATVKEVADGWVQATSGIVLST